MLAFKVVVVAGNQEAFKKGLEKIVGDLESTPVVIDRPGLHWWHDGFVLGDPYMFFVHCEEDKPLTEEEEKEFKRGMDKMGFGTEIDGKA